MGIRFETSHLHARWVLPHREEVEKLIDRRATATLDPRLSFAWIHPGWGDERSRDYIPGLQLMGKDKHGSPIHIRLRFCRLSWARFCDTVGVSRTMIRRAVDAGDTGLDYVQDVVARALRGEFGYKEQNRTLLLQRVEEVDLEHGIPADTQYIIREILRPGDPMPVDELQVYDAVHDLSRKMRHLGMGWMRLSDYGSAFRCTYSEDECGLVRQCDVTLSIANKCIYIQPLLNIREELAVARVPADERVAVSTLEELESAMLSILGSFSYESHRELERGMDTPEAIAYYLRACKEKRVRASVRDGVLQHWDGSVTRPDLIHWIGKQLRFVTDVEQANRMERVIYMLLMEDIKPLRNDLRQAEKFLADRRKNPADWESPDRPELERPDHHPEDQSPEAAETPPTSSSQ